MNFDELPQFRKELKRLSKKYQSLPEDLQVFSSVVSVIPLGNSKHFHTITRTGALHIIKARLFCRYLKGSSLRIIYSYCEREQRIEFMEIYSKSDKTGEDLERIKEYLRNHPSQPRPATF